MTADDLLAGLRIIDTWQVFDMVDHYGRLIHASGGFGRDVGPTPERQLLECQCRNAELLGHIY